MKYFRACVGSFLVIYYKYRPIVMFRRVYGIFGQGLVPSDTHDGTIGQYHYLPKTIVSMNYSEC